TSFLVDYLSTYPEKIGEWWRADKKKRLSHFGPALIRNALDKRDGYTSGERTRIYHLISEIASHASYLGISAMTTTGPYIMEQVGPLFDDKKLASWLGEMALRLSIAAMRMPNPSGRDINLVMAQAHYLEVCQKWWWKYRGVKPQGAVG